MSEIAKCRLCGEPMPAGEEMFKFHGYSGDCPKPPIPKHSNPNYVIELMPHDALINHANRLQDERKELTRQLAEAQALLKELREQEPAMNITNGVVTWSQVPEGYNGQLFFKAIAQTSGTEALNRMLEAERVKVWNPIETAPKGKKVIVSYLNALNNRRTVMAIFYLSGMLQNDPDSDCEEEFAPEGWYELCEGQETTFPVEEEPTHWMPLPAAPSP